MTERSCDGCTLCCKILNVPELKKPPGPLCEKCVVGKGCSIQDSKPSICTTYKCFWLKSCLPEWAKPDLIGALFHWGRAEHVVIGVLDEGVRADDPVLMYLVDWLNDRGLTVCLIDGNYQRHEHAPTRPPVFETTGFILTAHCGALSRQSRTP